MLKGTILKIATRFMHIYWRWSRGLTIGVQCCLIDSDGKIMLVRHGYREGWHFPGGGVEKGESVVNALKRELSEEVGVTLTQPPDLFAVYDNCKHFAGDHVLVYVSRDWTQERVPEPSFEIAEIGRFAHHDLPKDIYPPTATRVSEILDNKAAAINWHVV